MVTKWTEQEIRIHHKLWADRFTTVYEMTIALNKTYNAVTDLARKHHLGKKATRGSLFKNKTKAAPVKKTEYPLIFWSYNKTHTKPRHGVHILDIRELQCREIIGEPANAVCCGKPIYRGSYCKTHARKNFAA